MTGMFFTDDCWSICMILLASLASELVDQVCKYLTCLHQARCSSILNWGRDLRVSRYLRILKRSSKRWVRFEVVHWQTHTTVLLAKVQILIASYVALSDVSVAIPCFGTLPGSWINRRSVKGWCWHSGLFSWLAIHSYTTLRLLESVV